MKKLFAALLALVILAMPVLAVDAGGNLGSVPYTLDEIKIDGVKDEVYAKGLQVKIEKTINKPVHATGLAYLLYDEENLYVYVEISNDAWHPDVTDDIIANKPWTVDNIEVLIDVKNAGNSADIHQHRIDAATGALSGQIGNPATQTTNGTEKVKAAKYFEGAKGEFKGGWAAEYKIPLTSKKVGINIMITDKPDANTAGSNMYVESKVTPTTAPGAWKGAEYPYISLDGKEVTAVVAKPKTETKAPATFDGLAVLAVVAALSGAGVVVSKKK